MIGCTSVKPCAGLLSVSVEESAVTTRASVKRVDSAFHVLWKYRLGVAATASS